MEDQNDPTVTLEALHNEVARLRGENAELRQRLGMAVAEPRTLYAVEAPELPLAAPPAPQVTNASPVQDKIKLFRSLFRGREDVFAARWTNERTGKSGYSPACEVPPWELRKGQPRKYLPLNDQVVHDHLAGQKTIGVFALLKDNTCWFLACDFDKDGWQLDAAAYLEACGRYQVPAYLERSRSGNGGHVWTFFSASVPAVQARQLGMRLLRRTMDARADLDLGSYDRFFPNQDFVPSGGFGNLIAAPLQKKCRALGNSEFVDASSQGFAPWPDQWAFLSSVRRLAPAQLEALLETVPPVEVGPGKTAAATRAAKARHPAPERIRCELDAAFFHLYLPTEKNGDWRPVEGETPEEFARLKASFPTPRHAVAYIMDTFPIVKRKDEEKFGSYRSKNTILEICDGISESIRSGRPYRTRLDPPPADPRVRYPERTPAKRKAQRHE